MDPIILSLSSAFVLVLLLFEKLLLNTLSKLKSATFIALFVLTLLTATLYGYMEQFEYFLASYYVLFILSAGSLLYQIFIVYRASTMKNNYHQLFMKSLIDLNRNVFLVTDERDRIREISKSLLDDMNLEPTEVINRKWMDIVHQCWQFKKMNQSPTDNNAIEQYYLKYNATYKSQKDKPIELEYINDYGLSQVIHATERPIIINNRFKGRILVGEKITTDFMSKSKKEVAEVKHALRDLQLRFQSTISILHDGLYFLDEGKQEIWGTDEFRKLIGSEQNTMSWSSLLDKIHPGDIEQYRKQMELKARKRNYQLNYRLVIGGHDRWVLEKGEYIETSNGPITVAVLKESNSRNVTNKIPFLDNQDYKLHIKDLIRRSKTFWIVRFDINTVSEMNIKYGREATEHATNEFLRKLKHMYHKSDSKMYELAQNQYAVVMENREDYSILKKGLLSSSDLFHFEKMMGGIEISFHPSIGIVEYPKNESEFDEIIKAAEQAVLVAGKDISRYHYCFYKDIQDVFS